MSADLHIIVVPERVSIEDIKFYSTWDFPENDSPEELEKVLDRVNTISDALYHSHDDGWLFPDDVWVGQVSTAKAGLLGEYRKYIPRSVEAIMSLYHRRGGVVRITPEIIPAITTAFNLPHDSVYETVQLNDRGGKDRRRYMQFAGVARARDVKKFLEKNIGKDTYVDLW